MEKWFVGLARGHRPREKTNSLEVADLLKTEYSLDDWSQWFKDT